MTLIHLWINYAAQRSGRPEDVPLFMVFFVLSIPFGFFAFLSNFLARRAYASAVKEKPGFEKFYNKYTSMKGKEETTQLKEFG